MTLIITNKPNFLESQMNVSADITVDYENKCNWTLGENKPNQTQSAGQKQIKKSQIKRIL
jgi:hypothetical protein